MENKIDFPPAFPSTDPDQLMQLAQKIIDQHVKTGAYSPLQGNHVADLSYKLKMARDKHEEGLKYKRLMEEAWHERDHFLGLGEKDTLGLKQKITVMIETLKQ